ncbi:MAG: dienelactone hydrolase family protein [Pseudomonadota bacterium]
MTHEQIDPRIYDLYDEYCHGKMERREFLARAGAITVAGGLSGLAMAKALLPNYARAQTISFTDARIKARYVTYPSPGGNADPMRGYLVQPAGEGPFPAVLIVHENRGLNPHIEDVARRAAVEGFLALAPDALTPVGGYPGNDDDGKVLQRQLDRQKIHVDMLNGAKFLKAHALSTGKLGVTGFCFGGGVSNYLAVEMGDDLQASVPFYGAAPRSEDVPKIKAAVLVHYAEDDPRINAMRADYEAALKAAGTRFGMHTYPGTRHGFHNNSTPRFNEEAAKLAWQRTMDFFRKHLG